MEKRVSFNSKNIRDLFFSNALASFKLRDWKALGGMFHIKRNTLIRYRSGESTLPNNIYKKLTLRCTKKDVDFFNKNITFFEGNWGRVKGGKLTYSKYKYIFDEGRKKGLKKFKKKYSKFNINLSLSKELSYFIGLFIGDGFTNKYGKYYLTQFTGHSLYETEYYKNTISEISKNLFNLSPKIIKERNSNTLRINFYSKDLFVLITKRFGIKAGRKSSEVLIPREIFDSDKDVLLSCIAGIYDAEACFYLDKRKIYKEPYPTTELHLNNPNLIKQISIIFRETNIKHYIRDNFSRIYIYGQSETRNFLRKIKLLNPKIINKMEKP